jgi:hypothetical protein
MLGTTDRGMKFLIPKLREAGYEAIVFHSSGVGGQVMEDMIGRGFFCGVVDLSTNELTDHVCGGFHNAGPHRLEAAGNLGLPQVIVPGCVDFFALGARDTVPEKFNGRKMYYHNPAFTLIRPSVEEMQKIGNLFVRKLNEAKGPVRVVLLRGMSIPALKEVRPTIEGGPCPLRHDRKGSGSLIFQIELRSMPTSTKERFIDRESSSEFLEITERPCPFIPVPKGEEHEFRLSHIQHGTPDLLRYPGIFEAQGHRHGPGRQSEQHSYHLLSSPTRSASSRSPGVRLREAKCSMSLKSGSVQPASHGTSGAWDRHDHRRAKTFQDMMYDICRSLIHHGFNKS